jgi:carbamoyl-phosphate synthase large subunit
MQHIEEAGVHSGDSACVLPPYKISTYHQSIIRDYTEQLGRALHVRGLMNVQYAIKDDIVYVLEVNPRASRTVPFVSKATNCRWRKFAAGMAGDAGRDWFNSGGQRLLSRSHSAFPANLPASMPYSAECSTGE